MGPLKQLVTKCSGQIWLCYLFTLTILKVYLFWSADCQKKSHTILLVLTYPAWHLHFLLMQQNLQTFYWAANAKRKEDIQSRISKTRHAFPSRNTLLCCSPGKWDGLEWDYLCPARAPALSTHAQPGLHALFSQPWTLNLQTYAHHPGPGWVHKTMSL